MNTYKRYESGKLVESGVEPPDWPLFLRPFKMLAGPEDRGLGDIIVRVIGPVNSEAFKRWYRATFKKDCGCAGRQNFLNRRYPIINTKEK